MYLFSIKELHGRKFFCKRYQTLRLLRNVPHFVENANSLFCSHRLTNGPPLQRTHPSLKLCVTFNFIPLSYGKMEISLSPTSMHENNPLSTVNNCLFIICTVNLQTWSSFPTYKNKDMPYYCKKIPSTVEALISFELSTFTCRNIQTYSCCRTRIPTALLQKQQKQYITRTDTLLTYISIRICELCSSITCQHIDDDDLSPFIHIHKKITQFPIIFMD